MTIIGNAINRARAGVSNVSTKTRVLVAGAGSAVLVTAAHAQTAPTTIDGVAALSGGYIDKGTAAAVAAGILAFGWVGFRIVKKFTKGVTST